MTAAWRDMVVDYLRVRRSLGFKLEYTERLLFKFIDYLHAHDADAMTIEHAVRFATAAEGASPRWQALRLSAVRCFSRWALAQDPTVQIPPARLLPARVTRAAPYIYTDSEVAALLNAASQLRPPIRAATFRTLVALMASTGIRTGEAIGLNISDLDQRAATLTVTGKYGKVRQLPLHPTVLKGLTKYLDERDRLHSAATCPALLVSLRGTRLVPQSVHPTFRRIADSAGLHPVSSACRPRLHDLRHTFAVATMLSAYRSASDPGAVLPVLATWMGHADPNDTYWYYSDSRVIPMSAPSCA
jgi:integrase